MKSTRTAVALATLLFSAACWANQPHMEAALQSLEQARASLEKASADKGGHRVKAIKLVDDAIAQVKSGIEFARKNK